MFFLFVKYFFLKKMMKKKKEILNNKKYEYGAYFKHIDLYKKLIDLMSIIPSERLGLKGIYFQDNKEENKKYRNSTISFIHKKTNFIKSNSGVFEDSDKKINYFNNSKDENCFITLPKIINLKRKNIYLFTANKTISDFFKDFKSRNNVKFLNKIQNTKDSQTIDINNLDFLKNNKKYYQFYFNDQMKIKRDNSSYSNRKLFKHFKNEKIHHNKNLSNYWNKIFQKKTFSIENEKNNEISNLKTIENNKRISPFSSNRNKKPIRIFKKVTFKMSKN